MDRTRKTRWAWLALALALVLSLLCPLSAAAVEPEGGYSLTVTDQSGGTAIPGAAFRLYKAADFTSDLQFALTGDFAASGVAISASGTSATWAAQASTLEAFLVQQKAAGTPVTPAASGTTDSSGKVAFTGLARGLYLLVGDEVTVGRTVYTPTPILLTLPYQQSLRNWEDAPAINAKNSSRTIPDTPSPGSSKYSLSVVKVWEDDDDSAQQRPQSVTVTLYRNDKAYSTVTLNAANNWRHTWTGLSSTSNCYVTEPSVPEGYTVTSVRNGTSFVVTNTYTTPPDTPRGDEPDNPPDEPTPDTPETPDTPSTPETPTPDTPTTPTTTVTTKITTPSTPATQEKLPQTGQLWWPVTAMTVAGLALVLVGWGLRKKGEDHESD